MAAGEFDLSGDDRKRIAEAIAAAEKTTSGEIVVRIVRAAKGPPRDHALKEFHRLGLEKTRDRTGVLLYIAERDRAIEVLGDAGIHANVPDGFWNGVVSRLSGTFKEGRFADGICTAVGEIGGHLTRHFPPKADDTDELSNAPVIDP